MFKLQLYFSESGVIELRILNKGSLLLREISMTLFKQVQH